MKNQHPFVAAIAAMSLLLISLVCKGDPIIDKDLSIICGWYQSLASEEKLKDYSAENKFTYVFDAKRQEGIKNMSMRKFYAALRTTNSTQRYELMKAYAQGTSGTNWGCLPMEEIMKEFNSIDPIFQYAH